MLRAQINSINPRSLSLAYFLALYFSSSRLIEQLIYLRTKHQFSRVSKPASVWRSFCKTLASPWRVFWRLSSIATSSRRPVVKKRRRRRRKVVPRPTAARQDRCWRGKIYQVDDEYSRIEQFNHKAFQKSSLLETRDKTGRHKSAAHALLETTAHIWKLKLSNTGQEDTKKLKRKQEDLSQWPMPFWKHNFPFENWS